MNDDPTCELLFRNHPDPAWIYGLDSLRFLDVNDAAIEVYGYARDEFLAMTIADIRPAEDVPALLANVQAVGKGRDSAGIWRHRLSTGEIIHVDIVSHTLHYQGVAAELVIARNVSSAVEFQQERAELLRREQESRNRAEAAAHHFRALFESAPGKFLVLEPEAYVIVAVSDAYLEATMRDRADLEGRQMFEAFPDDPDDPDADGVRNMRASLERVKHDGVTDVMAVQRYPIPRPERQGGGFEVRYWSPVNTPVRDAHGALSYIIHRVEDVTDVVAAIDEDAAGQEAEAVLWDPDSRLRLDILLRSRELKEANTALREQQANLRTAQRLLGIGLWKQDLASGLLAWSDPVYAIYGVSRGGFDGTVDSYVARVHPEDRDAMLENYEAWKASGSDVLEFRHRVVRDDGSVVHVHGIGERTDGFAGPVLTGVVQDISRQVEESARLAEVNRLIDIAGRVARLGGWRVDLSARRMQWSETTAAIHGLPGVWELDLDAALEHFLPEDRARMRQAFDACAEEGQSFIDVGQIAAAEGGRAWVRVIGEPERDARDRIVALRGAFQDVSELVSARRTGEDLGQRLRRTLESMSDAFYLLDPRFRFVYVNPQAQRLLRQEGRDLIGAGVWEAFPEARPILGPLYEDILAGGEPGELVFPYPPLSTWFRVRAFPGPEGLAVYFRDVTRERDREEHLQLLEAAVARQNDALVITGPQVPGAGGAPIVYVNEAFTRQTGYAREEVLGRTPALLFGPRTQRESLDRIRGQLRCREPFREAFIAYTRDQREIWLDVDAAPIIDDAGTLTHWVAVQRDITERKAAEDALRESNERFHVVTRATNDVIRDCRLQEDRIWWNENLADRFGFPRGTTYTDAGFWGERIHGQDRERIEESLRLLLESDGSMWQQEYRFARADGQYATVVDRGFVQRDEGGQPHRLIASMLDVTEQRELDERLRQSQKLEAVGQLTGGVAHDFNNLLTVILGNAEILQDRLGDQKDLQALAAMSTTAALRGAELTSRLLAFSRRQALAPRSVDVNRLVTGMDGLLRRTLTEEIEVEFVRAGGLWPAEVDPGQLEVAILNLAINARDAMIEGGRLTIETANTRLDDEYAARHEDVKAGQYVMISVSDTGAGMPPEVVARAFEPFFTTKEVGAGNGLGLSMVYGFVKQSGGHAKIYTEEGEGTTVRLYVPRAETEVVGESAEAVAGALPGGPEHILVVEDNELVREHVIAQLLGLGYRVTGAGSGPEALTRLEQHDDVDLLLTDVVMPGGMNGRQLAEAVRIRRPGIRVLYTSGYTENAIVHQGRLDRGVELLSKPYRLRELAAKVRRVLDGPPA